MKKLMFFLIVFCAICTTSIAQTDSTQQTDKVLNYTMTCSMGLGFFDTDFAEYYTFVPKTKEILFTSEIAFFWGKEKSFSTGTDFFYGTAFSTNNYYNKWGFLANFDYHWARNDTRTFYSGIGLGYKYEKVLKNIAGYPITTLAKIHGAYSIKLIGFQRMRKNTGIDISLALGNEGTLRAAFQYGF